MIQKCNTSNVQGVLNPRNREQVRNEQKQILRNQQIGTDDIIGLTDIINLFNDLLTLQSEDFQLILAYDTTFQHGDFYVSPLLFRHIYFYGSPIIPLSILINDRKFQVSHEKLFTKISEKIPNLKKKKVPIITEREKGINNATKLIPSLCPILCWNHICQDIKTLGLKS